MLMGIHSGGKRSLRFKSLELRLNHSVGRMTILVGFWLRYAPHQLKVELAIMFEWQLLMRSSCS